MKKPVRVGPREARGARAGAGGAVRGRVLGLVGRGAQAEPPARLRAGLARPELRLRLRLGRVPARARDRLRALHGGALLRGPAGFVCFTALARTCHGARTHTQRYHVARAFSPKVLSACLPRALMHEKQFYEAVAAWTAGAGSAEGAATARTTSAGLAVVVDTPLASAAAVAAVSLAFRMWVMTQ